MGECPKQAPLEAGGSRDSSSPENSQAGEEHQVLSCRHLDIKVRSRRNLQPCPPFLPSKKNPLRNSVGYTTGTHQSLLPPRSRPVTLCSCFGNSFPLQRVGKPGLKKLRVLNAAAFGRGLSSLRLRQDVSSAPKASPCSGGPRWPSVASLEELGHPFPSEGAGQPSPPRAAMCWELRSDGGRTTLGSLHGQALCVPGCGLCPQRCLRGPLGNSSVWGQFAPSSFQQVLSHSDRYSIS